MPKVQYNPSNDSHTIVIPKTYITAKKLKKGDTINFIIRDDGTTELEIIRCGVVQ